MKVLKFVKWVNAKMAALLNWRAAVREKAGRKALDAGDALVDTARKAVDKAEAARSTLVDKAGELALESVELRKVAQKLEA